MADGTIEGGSIGLVSAGCLYACYPSDLRAGSKEVADLFSWSRVAFVGTGHTHYNELVNHEGVIYAARRSTGEVEEGPPGFSLGVLDGSVVS